MGGNVKEKTQPVNVEVVDARIKGLRTTLFNDSGTRSDRIQAARSLRDIAEKDKTGANRKEVIDILVEAIKTFPINSPSWEIAGKCGDQLELIGNTHQRELLGAVKAAQSEVRGYGVEKNTRSAVFGTIIVNLDTWARAQRE